MMDPKWKEVWIRALRGEIKNMDGKVFTQGRATLCGVNTGAMCCLGVLAYLQDPMVFDEEGDGYRSDNDRNTSQLQERHAAGLTDTQMEILAGMNDGKEMDTPEYHPPLTFEQIAAWIERSL